MSIPAKTDAVDAYVAHGARVRVRAPSVGDRRASFRVSLHRRTSDALPEEVSPALRVRCMLGVRDDEPGLESHPIFSELEELRHDDDGEWKEAARWVKFEEDVEDGGCRWSKPFVGTLSLHALFELRSYLLQGTVLLDMESSTLDGVVNGIVDDLIKRGKLQPDDREKVCEVLLRPHRHLYEIQKHDTLLNIAEKNRNQSTKSLVERGKIPSSKGMVPTASSSDFGKGNSSFLRKIPPGAEVSNILVGEVDFLDEPVAAFVRLSNASILGNITEVRLPTRFVFVLLGPVGGLATYREVGRAVATLMSDEVFHEVAYRAKKRDHLLTGIDEFLDAVTVLPPGEWDPNIRIDPPKNVPSQEPRKNPDRPPEEKADPCEEEMKAFREQGLVRTGRFFGGLVNDIKRKAPWYLSDFTDGISVQSIASITFLYFASLSPIITFGGLLGEATENRLAAVESLCAGCLCGLIFSLFAGQPLSLLNATGPVLVFETILYEFCKKYGFYYLTVRLWVGVWIGVFMLILCAFDISAWVCYITRFTEENFALLIATIYLYKAVEKVIQIGLEYPLFPPEPKLNATDCYCHPSNGTSVGNFTEPLNWMGLATNSCTEDLGGTLVGEDCFPVEWHPNVFLMSVLLTVFTFYLCNTIKALKRTPYFPAKVRNTISDFAVFLVICSMTATDYYFGVSTPKLYVPSEFKPTWPERGWLVPFVHPNNPWWLIPGTMLPAVLATILMFLDQQITAVIVNRKENKLKKGCGYHLDLFVLAFITALMGILGLPWHVAGTVICINHVNSLKLETETAAPGDKPQFLGVREQRVTHFFIFLLVGLSVFMTPILKFIPMPVLYGVFLYMGTAPLADMQFYDRLRIIFMPAKYQPDLSYLRQVRLKRVHLFTIVQLICFAALWVVKTNEAISIGFPMMLVVMIGIRKALDYIYTKDELRALDGVIPPFRQKKKKKDSEDDKDKAPVAMNGSKLPTIPSKLNISNEVNRSGVWKHVQYNMTQNEFGTELKAVRRVNYSDSRDQDETEPLTFKAGSYSDNPDRAPLAQMESSRIHGSRDKL